MLVAPATAFLVPEPDHVPVPESIVSNMAISEQNKALQGCAGPHEILQKLIHVVALLRESDHDQLLHVRVALHLAPP